MKNLIFLTLFLPASVFGATTYEILKTPASPQISALGGAFYSYRGNINSVFTNPAGLGTLEKMTFSASYSNEVLDFTSGSFAFAKPSDFGVYGFSVRFKDFGEFDYKDNNGILTGGKFNAYDYVFGGTLAQKLGENYTYGVNLKLLYSKIENAKSSAFAVDLGGTYFYEPLQIAVGGGLFELGKQINAYVKTKENLPTNAQIELGKSLEHLPLTLTFNNRYYFYDKDYEFSVGLQFDIKKSFDLRFSYDSVGTDRDLGFGSSKFSGISFGFGIHKSGFTFDYSGSSWGEVGFQNRFGISKTF
ncbi:PorV/PorQ family protein [bacterium]|nr:PorV/PorQ family protein [bacterium]